MSDTRLQSLRDAVRAAPAEPSLHALLARALSQAGLLEEAEQEFHAALRLDPTQTSWLIDLATLKLQQGDSAGALKILDDLLISHGDDAATLVLRARILLAQGDVDQARESYRQAVAADPSSTDPQLQARLVPTSASEPSDPMDNGKPEPFNSVRRFDLERPSISFADVGGMEELKEEIRLKLIYPMKNPDLYRSYGQAAGGGILMYGPPGCGKTYLARATAGEIDATFVAVGLHNILDMWIGQSERNLHELFEIARSNRPCVLFFDEIDALGASRADMRTSAGRHVINQFLSEMDGASSSNDGILVLGATNAPWHLDTAFRRPGRFDSIIFVPPPDRAARAEILRALLEHRPTDAVDITELAKRTEGLSGADLKGVVDRATSRRLRDAVKSGEARPISTSDLLEAAKGAPPSTADWFLTARNYVFYSNESGLYDPVRPYLKA
jgi:SpoVK/Ycf46/Vps4 family AAA+-type ATPase